MARVRRITPKLSIRYPDRASRKVISNTQAVLPSMRQNRLGRIVNIGSTAGLRGAAYISAYAASKAALVSLTQSLSAELVGTGVTANIVCPGFVDTDIVRRAVRRLMASRTDLNEDAARREILNSSNQRRMLRPEEVAAVVLELSRAEAQTRNGEVIVLDGMD